MTKDLKVVKVKKKEEVRKELALKLLKATKPKVLADYPFTWPEFLRNAEPIFSTSLVTPSKSIRRQEYPFYKRLHISAAKWEKPKEERVFKESIYFTDKGETKIVFLKNCLSLPLLKKLDDLFADETLPKNFWYQKADSFRNSSYFGWWLQKGGIPFPTPNTQGYPQFFEKLKIFKPLWDQLTFYVQAYFPAKVYMKLLELPEELRFFGLWTLLVFNKRPSRSHKDRSDLKNSVCAIFPTNSEWQGGDLELGDFRFLFQLRMGDVIFFDANMYVHGNQPLEKGERHTVVLSNHGQVQQFLSTFSSLPA
jgi:hypothetical protein